jgi:hypothetical protein
MSGKVLARYDAVAVAAMLEQVGVYRALDRKGFCRFEVTIDTPEHGLSHTRLFARKKGNRHRLLDACITEVTLQSDFFRERGFEIDRALNLLSLYWLREEDPTAHFTADRPPLPLQHHPGLGILHVAFRAIVRMAREMEKDGVACMPKFFHDATIFFRSRLFLFLDGTQQGRFEALLRDLRSLPLGTASALLAADGVRDHRGDIVRWELASQVLPLADVLSSYFNSPGYAGAVAEAYACPRFTWSSEAVLEADRLVRSAAP